jgi:molybdopterin molybdotransferase
MENERRIMRGASTLLSRKGFDAKQLLAPQQAVIAFLSRAALARPRSESVALDAAAGRVLAQDVVSDRAFPSAPRSTMDGFAIRAADAPGALRVAGEVIMGAPPAAIVGARETMRIPTGGMLPAGADAVVPFERVLFDGEVVRIDDGVVAGDCVTAAGEDLKAGERILQTGRRIAPAEAGILATLGHAHVRVFVRPQVAVISCGDELVEPAEVPGPAQTRDSNRYAIAAALRAMGTSVTHYPTARDEPGALEAVLRSAVARSDAVAVSGGSSVGERDRTPAAIAALGEPGVIVHGLRVKPGKPTVLAAVAGKPIIGLPGNPASALMILETVCAPIVAALTGWAAGRIVSEAELAETVESRRGWTWYVPVELCEQGTRYRARPLAMRSSLVSLCAHADGFIIVDEGTERLERGSPVRVHHFSKGW